VLGLGTATKLESVEIRWPSGKVDKLTNLPVNTYVKVVEGSGLVKSGTPSNLIERGTKP
jgi:hypothetical protein